MKKVGIVICNYNKAEKALECIQCILESKFQDFDVYVVDNASSDNSVDAIKERYGDKVTLIVNEENLGGSGGFNKGLRTAYDKGYEYLMCVDNDAMLDENAVGNLYTFLEEHEEAGMAGSKIYHLENPDYIQQFGQEIDFEYFCTVVPHLNMYEDGSMPDYLYVDSVAACSLMVRRSTIDKIGFIPEENFLYWDDTEWCYLCNKAGMKVASVGNSMALHAMGAKNEDVNTFPTYYAWRNWIRFFAKYTDEKRLSKMADVFLDSIFQIVYEGLHNGEESRVKTVMLAYEDAINNVTGKAGENRIFDLDFNEKNYRKVFEASDTYYIEENGHEVLAQRIKQLAEDMGYHIDWKERECEGVKNISLCDNIFEIDDMTRNKIYIDINDCIFMDEDDALDIINYNYSKRTFIFAQKPVFLEKIREMRECCQSDKSMNCDKNGMASKL